MRYTDIFNNEQLIALRLEFEKACGELMLGTNADDDKRRQDLAKLMLSLAENLEATLPASASRPYGLCGRRHVRLSRKRDLKHPHDRGVTFHIVARLQTVAPAVDVDDLLSDGFNKLESFKGSVSS